VSIGLVVGMYFVPQRIVAIIRSTGDRQSAVIGGRSERSRTIFADSFQKIVKQIESGSQS
jgi:hypothetical protein